ncbi:hypothetical protein 3 [Hubei tombus-like virus 43]|uniref:hypothetical protein 3 n=1 Tax=Hubei tombus-like virus 43 TaxID=1923291 RepID=UPI00090B5ED2|nr:hypothetical protein 3 [Hubei tombus-like virus 43]APG76475.1 hypothetical protein 3 [Hubei tombus-like virus 43]
MPNKQTKRTTKNTKPKQQRRKQPKAQRNVVSTQSAPVSRGHRIKQTAPKITASSKGVNVVHSEARSVAVTSGSSTVDMSWTLLPQGSNFPWLAAMAIQFDKIVWNKVSVTFVPIVGTNLGGDVVMYFDTEADDTRVTDYVSAYSMEGAVSGRVWDMCTLHAKHADLHNQKSYAAKGETSKSLIGSPGMFCMLATLQTAATANTIIGRWVINYDVTFLKPEAVTASSLLSLAGELDPTAMRTYIEAHWTDYYTHAACVSNCPCYTSGDQHEQCYEEALVGGMCLVDKVTDTCSIMCPCNSLKNASLGHKHMIGHSKDLIEMDKTTHDAEPMEVDDLVAINQQPTLADELTSRGWVLNLPVDNNDEMAKFLKAIDIIDKVTSVREGDHHMWNGQTIHASSTSSSDSEMD